MFDRNRPAGALVGSLNKNKALLALLVMLAFFSLAAPNFFSLYNFKSILKVASLSGITAIGFTIIVILGHLDLSVGAVLMLSGTICISLQPQIGWPLSFLVAVLSGSAVGLLNGLVIVKGKLNSFIVTIGTQIITLGIMFLISQGGALYVDDFTLADWLDKAFLFILTPLSLLTIMLVILFSFILNQTRLGRSLFMIGSNADTAWLAGLKTSRLVILGFVICSALAAVAGALFSMSISSMTTQAILGNKTLMQVISAVFIGGSSISGGKGNVLKSYTAVLLLIVISNGLGCFGLGFEVQIFINGLILAVVVLYESIDNYYRRQNRGKKSYLLSEKEEKGGNVDAF